MSIQSINNLLSCLNISLVLIFMILSGNWIYSVAADDDSGLILGGLLSGALHALTGPDHLAALLPSIVGKQWWISCSYGGLWGLGHSVASCFLATCGYFLEDSVSKFTTMSFIIEFADFAIGFTLIIIGIMGVLESQQLPESEIKENDSIITNEYTTRSTENQSMFISFPTQVSPRVLMMRILTVASAIFVNGMFLGLSWDGLPSLAPALSADSWRELTMFVISYSAGTIFSMGIVSGLIGFSTSWLGSLTDDTIPMKLAYSSSIVACCVGLVWILRACFQMIRLNEYHILQVIIRNLAVTAPLVIAVVMIGTISQQYMCCQRLLIFKSNNSKSDQSIATFPIKADIHIV